MKKFLALIPAAALAFTYIGCKKEDVGTNEVSSVSSMYKAVVWEYTATWCPPCGSTAYPILEDVIHTWRDSACRATVIILHKDDGITDGVLDGQEGLEDFYGWGSTPGGGVNITPGYPNYNSITTKINQGITANLTAKAGVGIAYTTVGASMTIKTKTVFFSDQTGTYNLGVYVIENDVMHTQSGQTGTVEHDAVLRAIAGGQSFGTTIATNPAKGTKIDGEYSITVPQLSNPNNLRVVCVIYKMDPSTGEPLDIINSNSL